MATIDPSIALGVKPIQLQDPINRMAAMQGIETGMQTNQLNALKMREAEQEIQNRNTLRGLDPDSPDYIQQVSRFNPDLGLKLIKSRDESASAKLTREKTLGEINAQKLTETREAYKDLDFNPSDANYTAFLQDAVLKKRMTQDQADQEFASIKLLNADQRKAYNRNRALKAETYFGESAPTTQQKDFLYGQQNSAFTAYEFALKRAGANSTKVILPEQEKEFEKELGGGQAKAILKSREGADAAAIILQTNRVGRDLLNSGAITGAGADFFVGLNQGLKTAGIDFGYADASANSQAYAAAMGQNTAQLIKQFGAGTGLSDADRKYAEKIAAGQITMDEKAIRNILDINDTAARNVINNHNKKVEGIKTNIPLKITIDTPPTFAINKKTGERIQSTDGGKNWSPVGAK